MIATLSPTSARPRNKIVATTQAQPTPFSSLRWQTAVTDSLADATVMLDWLERDGHRERELQIVGQSHFIVRWR